MTNREIDRTIAEKVMGWSVFDKETFHTSFLYEGIPNLGTYKRGDRVPMYEFNPSESIEKAWLVVEKMKDSGFTFMMDYNPVDNDDLESGWQWLVSFGHNNDFPQADIINKSASMAICLASLKAIGCDHVIGFNDLCPKCNEKTDVEAIIDKQTIKDVNQK